MSYQIFNEASLGKFIELIKNKVKSMVDNATVASAQKATNDSDGNAINTTYRKVADSYSKAEVDEVDEYLGSKVDTISTDELISKYTAYELFNNFLDYRKTVYLSLTENDPIYGMVPGRMSMCYHGGGIVAWAAQLAMPDGLGTAIVSIEDTDADVETGSLNLSYTVITTNTYTLVSTIDIAVAAWDSTSKTATVSAMVTADCAVDVAPAESSYDDYVNAGIRATAQSGGTDGNGTLTFTCKTIPTKVISVNIKAMKITPLFSARRNVKQGVVS